MTARITRAALCATAAGLMLALTPAAQAAPTTAACVPGTAAGPHTLVVTVDNQTTEIDLTAAPVEVNNSPQACPNLVSVTINGTAIANDLFNPNKKTAQTLPREV